MLAGEHARFEGQDGNRRQLEKYMIMLCFLLLESFDIFSLLWKYRSEDDWGYFLIILAQL